MFMNTRNTKANGAHNFFPNLSQRLVHKVVINMFLLKTYLFIIGGKYKRTALEQKIKNNSCNVE